MRADSVTLRGLRVAMLILVTTTVPASKAQEGQTAAGALEQAIQLYNEGNYVGAQHALGQIDAAKLDESGKAAHAQYVQRSAVAVQKFQESEKDYESALIALADGRFDAAKTLLTRVVDNEFSTRDTVVAARKELAKLRTADEVAPVAVQPPDQPVAGKSADNKSEEAAAPVEPVTLEMEREHRMMRAKVMTRDGQAALTAGRYSEAERLFNHALDEVPGYPEATQGLEQAAQHEMVESGARDLTDRIRQRNAVAWQRTVTTFRDAEREVREHVLANRYEQAGLASLRARQVVEAGKGFAEPLSRYEALLNDSVSLARYVEDEERRFNEQEVGRQREEARQEYGDRVRTTDRNRQDRINALMQEALQHRKDRDYESAINVLKQVLVVDPNNDNARWLMDILEDQLAYSSQREIHDDSTRETQKLLIDVKRSHIPWWQDITYPKNWMEIISRPSRTPPGTDSVRSVDPDLQSKLDRPIRLEIDGEPFNEVIERLAYANEANISVAWSDLSAAAIDPKTPVSLKLPNPVPLRTALSLVLDQVEGTRNDLDFLPDEGVIKVATRDYLNKTVYEEVYDVRDLLMPIPDFDDAPSMDLSDPATFAGAIKNAAAAKAISTGRTVFPEGYVESPPEVIEEDANRLMSLIRETIDPDSWRGNNGDVGSIRELNGQLVITQTPTGQARVGGLLSKLREQRAIQVAIEARFITVQSNYLEEMGMDLDIVLNAGNAGFDFLENPDARGNLLVDPVLGNRLLLPRSFTRYGFTPTAPGVGNTLATGSTNSLVQPFNEPGLVPQRGNSLTSGGSVTPVPIINNVLPFTDPGGLTSDLPGSFAGNPTLQPAFNLFGSFLDNIQVDFLIRATQADSRTSLLTAPRLVLFNGQRAWVAVVNQQSFVSSLMPVVDADGQQPIISTIETGAVLDAQVTVSADKRYVTMTLRPSVGRLLGIQTFAFVTGAAAGAGAFVQLPNISRQVLRTTVTVPDGGTLLIGGQKLAGEIEVESGVPILSKIPILKRLYSSKTMVKDEQVLLILIKPKVIIQSEAEQEAFPTFKQD